MGPFFVIVSYRCPAGDVNTAERGQASNFSAASARLKNQWAFKHSWRNFPLKASMKALSVGLPGLLNPKPHPDDMPTDPNHEK